MKRYYFFDIGAYTVKVLKYFQIILNLKEIHCFEPSPYNFEILSKNIKKYNFKINVNLNNIGVGSEKKSVFLNQTEESSSSTINTFNKNSNYLKKKLKILNINNLNEYYKKISINLISLDEYIEKNNINEIDIIKIDTEGFEFDVIKGLSLKNKKIRFIYFEHHYDDMIVKNYTFKDINSLN